MRHNCRFPNGDEKPFFTCDVCKWHWHFNATVRRWFRFIP